MLTVQAATFTTANGGSVVLDVDGNFDYAPAANFSGSDGFDYTLFDGHAGQDVGTVRIDVTALNDPPVAQDDQFRTVEDTPVSGDLFADNGKDVDSDPDSDMLTVTRVDGSSDNVGAQTMLPSGALLTLRADGHSITIPMVNSMALLKISKRPTPLAMRCLTVRVASPRRQQP